MNIDLSTPMLGGLSPRAFMRRHWQKRPLLIRQAFPRVEAPVSRSMLFALAARDDVESRLVIREAARWTLRHGPLPRRALPHLRQPGWTLLVQGLDLHVDAAHRLLQQFRFVPDARLDDLMMSYASEGGGVGPHVDSYDVFLLQVHGVREWRIGRVAKPKLRPGVPLKILTNFVPEQTWRLEPGDMLYLPPQWAHDGIARGECMTCSIGFRAPAAGGLAAEVLQRVLDTEVEHEDLALYRDANQPASDTPGRMPASLQAFTAKALARCLSDPRKFAAALGEVLTEPKGNVLFESERALRRNQAVVPNRCTRMLYDDHHVFINGEAFRAGGRDATLLRRLTDERVLAAADLAKLSPPARLLLNGWVRCGWLRGEVLT